MVPATLLSAVGHSHALTPKMERRANIDPPFPRYQNFRQPGESRGAIALAGKNSFSETAAASRRALHSVLAPPIGMNQ